MVVVKIWGGGLGNQLFQYAFGYAMAKEHDDDLYLDTSFFRKHQYSYVGKRTFDLDKLQIPIKVADDVSLPAKFLELFAINRIIHRHSNSIVWNIGNTCFIKEEKRKFMSSVPYQSGRINYYDGYWQTSLYFDKYKNDFRQMMSPSFDNPVEMEEILKRIEHASNSVSVHIRKGDYSGKIGYAVEDGYYARAVSLINDRIDRPTFFVFSDDIKWVKENINFGAQTYYSEYKGKNGAILDLVCMSKCQHGIMSASTFSWWGNWFKDGLVVVPESRYGNDRFVEDRWVKVK